MLPPMFWLLEESFRTAILRVFISEISWSDTWGKRAWSTKGIEWSLAI